MQISPSVFYKEQLANLELTHKKLHRKKTLFSWLRFLFILGAFIAPWQLWNYDWPIPFFSSVFFFALFIYSVLRDIRNREAMENNRLLIAINEQELAVLDHQYTDLPAGENLVPVNHSYANDLDIFGKASLYQYINRTQSEQGNQRMADWLLEPANPDTILQRQEAALDLAARPEWMHQVQAYGTDDPISLATENKIDQWRNTPNRFSRSKIWIIVRFLFPAIAFLILGNFIAGRLDSNAFIMLLVLLFIVAFGITRVIMPYYLQLEKIVPQLESLVNSIRWIESSPFESESMIRIKKELTGEGTKASDSIRKLKRILQRFEYRFNPLVHVPLNIFLFWDLQQVLALERWKTGNKANISAWFSALAETEALVSIATLTFNQPEWHFPKLNPGRSIFVSTELGHPLIPADKRVTSSFSTHGEKQLNLITGSNMAGKSTFLRSIGVNTVLAMMGAPTCCKQLEISWMKVISSMRISDNLEENTSTFYAELKKLKEIIEAVTRHEPVFLLLDEILRGTNSADRYTGSMALIRQMLKENASGLIATHDLELTKLAAEYPDNLHNYHFDVQVKDEELYFDYKLKAGICTSMNASLLMKKIGIQV